MIFPPARIVLIDDDEHHLETLHNAISHLGSTCLPFLYTDEDPTSDQLGHARVIFCDLHLGSDTLTSDKKIYYAKIASMLSETITPRNATE